MKRLIPLAALLCCTAHAEFLSGNDLYQRLQAGGVDHLVALGYIAGVHDLSLGTGHCAPPSATLGQVRLLVQRTLEMMPEAREKSADVIVLGALKGAWPCKKTPAERGVVL